jgi:hypothetical protein
MTTDELIGSPRWGGGWVGTVAALCYPGRPRAIVTEVATSPELAKAAAERWVAADDDRHYKWGRRGDGFYDVVVVGFDGQLTAAVELVRSG